MIYSQNNEQHHITEYFGDFKGRLLDLGAGDGIQFSNTCQLLNTGWKGVLVEPSPYLIPALIKNSREQDVEIIISPIGTEAAMKTWYDCGGDFLSSTNDKNVHLWKQVSFTRNLLIQQIHWMALKMRYGDTFDFINIDVEGDSANLFLQMLPEFPSCRLWCVEHDGKKDEILSSGMRMIDFNGENIIIGK